jgi:hypothetical protein
MNPAQVIKEFNNIRSRYTGTLFAKVKVTSGNLKMARKIYMNAESVNVPLQVYIIAQFETLCPKMSPESIHLGRVASEAAKNRAEKYDSRQSIDRYDKIRTVKLSEQERKEYWSRTITECAERMGIPSRTVEAIFQHQIPGGIY